MISGFVITAAHETDRQQNVQLLMAQVANLEIVDAIYPIYQKIPFLTKLQELSRQRTGTALNPGEIGILLTNRKIWRRIAAIADDKDSFLILESDSYLTDPEVFKAYRNTITAGHDLFFWGAWSGHMKLERSSRQRLSEKYVTGTPYLKTVYGAYGYSINRKAAKYLLRATGSIRYPVDQFKRYIKDSQLSIGGILPEMITHHYAPSTIGHRQMNPLRRRLWLFILDCKNIFICFFK